MPYTYPIPVEKAKFVSRPNRFIINVSYKSKIIRCHIPNPGRMGELLTDGATVLITFNNNKDRKTAASVIGVMSGSEVIQLQSNLVAKWLPQDFKENLVPGLTGWHVDKQEYTMGSYRFDFVLRNPTGDLVITEIKSTTRVKNMVACFPDGVSSRATKHLNALIEMAKNGEKVMIIFVVQRRADYFWPCESVDPKFAETFQKALNIKNLSIKIPLATSKLIAKSKKQYIHTEFIGKLPIKNPNLN
ncbi:MAG: DNA/RNA nuclease SfsA [Candidatus Kariarchaeaceae archaeon]|jgi:sugar fermentation stimulation protein A